MDNNNDQRPIQGEDWRSWLIPGSRQRIVNKIMELLKNHQPLNSGPEGLHELEKTAERFEEIIYTEATGQPDYLQKISLKMIALETESRKTIPSSLQANRPQESASLDSTKTAQTGDDNVGDWKEEVYQKIQLMKDLYLPELSEMLQVYYSLPTPTNSEQFDKLKLFKVMIERAISFLHTSKSDVLLGYKEKLTHYEKQIINCIKTNRRREPQASVDSTAQTGLANVDDWQEESVYLNSMKGDTLVISYRVSCEQCEFVFD